MQLKILSACIKSNDINYRKIWEIEINCVNKNLETLENSINSGKKKLSKLFINKIKENDK